MPQEVAKVLINRLSPKVSYDSMIIDIVINGFTPNSVKGHFHICYHSIVTFGMRGFGLRFSNTSHVDSLDRFRKSVVDKVKFDIRNLKEIIIIKKKI